MDIIFERIRKIENERLRTVLFALWLPWGHLKSVWFKLMFLAYLARLWWLAPAPESLRYAQCRFGDRLYIFSNDRPLMWYRIGQRE